MCLDVPSSFSCLTQTDWEVKWEVTVPLKGVFAEGQREQQSAPRQHGGCLGQVLTAGLHLRTFLPGSAHTSLEKRSRGKPGGE